MKKILIANRGEIALRIMRSIKEMGIKTVAIFSEADRMSPHTRYADEAIYIGEAPSAQSYLQADRIIQAALQLGVDAIHPGYGFLSENADFAQKVTEAGLVFIGPSPYSISIMGSKLAAKQAVAQYRIPMVPGTDHAISSPQQAREIALAVGFPILIKASAGGGGKGMRIAQNEAELDEQLQRAQSEALAAFGDSSVFIEKYIASPRHIEIQVLADQYGNTVHLFERECSIQRRHQKVIEEAPSAILNAEFRQAMGQTAVQVAKACQYTGAGTVEFLVDENLNFYFLEMNTRLQVEHPVTEMITGLDLVKLQVQIAKGEKLPFQQSDIQLNGHAIELRVYAEDPSNNFLPDIGTLKVYQRPQGPGIRVDDGFEQGMTIPIYYDPMIAKLVVYAPTRKEAIAKMIRAIDEYQIVGVANTLAFGKLVMQHPAFADGQFDTNFIKHHFKPEMLAQTHADEAEIAAMVAAQLLAAPSPTAAASPTPVQHLNISRWKTNRL